MVWDLDKAQKTHPSNCCYSSVNTTNNSPSRLSVILYIKCILARQIFNKIWLNGIQSRKIEFQNGLPSSYYVLWGNTPLYLAQIHLLWFISCHCIALITTNYSYKALNLSHRHSLSVAVRCSYKWLINNMSACPAHDKWILVTSAQAGRPGGQ